MNSDSPTSEEKTVTNIEIGVLTTPDEDGNPNPRMVAKTDDWCIVEYTNEGVEHDDMTTLHFVNTKKNISMSVAAYGKSAMFFEYNPVTNHKSDTIIMTAEKQGLMCMAVCRMNWKLKTYSIISETVLEEPSQSSPRSVCARVRDNNDDIRKLTFDFLEDISNHISPLSDAITVFVPDVLGVKEGALAVTSVWNKVAIPLMKHSLYDGYPDVQQEIREQYSIDTASDLCWSIFPWNLAEIKGLISFTYNEMFGGGYFDITDNDISTISSRFATVSNDTYAAQMEFAEEMPKYQVSAYLRSVTETTATIKASFDCLDNQQSYISEFGVKLRGSNGSSRTIKVNNFESDINITGLSPGVVYTATPYLKSFGSTYETSITFMTRVRLKLHPEKLSYEMKGGDKGVALDVPVECIKSWEIKSKPKWCEITKGKASFFVKVSETKEKRSGEIVVSATFIDGTTDEAVLPVEQKTSDWDGTNWVFNGSVNMTGNSEWSGVISMAEVSSFGIQIKDVKKNEFTLTGDLESMKSGSRIYCDDDNNLIWTYSESMSESGTSIRMESTIKFTRTSTNTANGKMTGSAKVSMTGGYSFDMGFNGNFLGTLVTDDNE